MNEIIKVLISAVLIVCLSMALASCGQSDTAAPSGTTGAEAGATDPEPVITDPEPDAAMPGTSVTTPTDDTGSDNTPQPPKEYELANPNTVLLNSKGVKLTALDFAEQTNEDYITIDVKVENSNTHDVNIMLNSLTVNGYLISGKLDSFTTKAGANQTVPFTISKRDIELAEIDEIREILVSFYAKDANYKSFISPTEPVSLKTIKYDTPANELNTDGVEVYNKGNILIVAKEELSSDSRYMLAKLLIKNSTDSRISVSCSKLLINGKEITNHNCIRYGNVPAGVISYNSMDIEKSELEKLGIQEIETIEMTLKILSEDYTLIADNLTATVEYN